jgi:hypothetical protein
MKKSALDKTKRLMAALGKMLPKPHEEMKLGKRSAKIAKSPREKRASAKPKTA